MPAPSLPPAPPENRATMEPASSLVADLTNVVAGAAAPPPVAPSTAPPPSPGADDLGVALGDREYRVRGLGRNLSYDSLKVTLRVARGGRLYLDTLDLYAARQRTSADDREREAGRHRSQGARSGLTKRRRDALCSRLEHAAAGSSQRSAQARVRVGPA